jgi:hypothetical protein
MKENDMNTQKIVETLEQTHGCHIDEATVELVIAEYRKQTIIGFRWDMEYVREVYADSEEMEGVEDLTLAEVKACMNQSAYDHLGYVLEGLVDELYDAVAEALRLRKAELG